MEGKPEPQPGSVFALEILQDIQAVGGGRDYLHYCQEQLEDNPIAHMFQDELRQTISDNLTLHETAIESSVDEFSNGFKFAYGALLAKENATSAGAKRLLEAIDNTRLNYLNALELADSDEEPISPLGILGVMGKRGLKRLGNSQELSRAYTEQLQPQRVFKLFYGTGIGIVADIAAEIEDIRGAEKLVDEKVPHFVYSDNLDQPNAELDEMDKAIWEFTDNSKEYFKEQETMKDWQKSIRRDGALTSIFRELQRALNSSRYVGEGDNKQIDKSVYGAYLLKGLTYGLRLGSKTFESGSITPETPEVGKIRISTARAYEHIGMTVDSDDLFEYYQNIENEFYATYYDNIFEEVSLYADENIPTRNSRSIFMTAAAIGLRLYEDANMLRNLELLLDDNTGDQ